MCTMTQQLSTISYSRHFTSGGQTRQVDRCADIIFKPAHFWENITLS